MKTVIIILIVLVVGAGVLAFLWYSYNRSSSNTNQTDTEASLNQNVNIQGQIAVEQKVSYKNTTFTVQSASQNTEYNRKKPETGKKFVIVFFRFQDLDSVKNAASWIDKDTNLIDSDNQTYELYELRIAGESDPQGISYFWFEVNEAASGFKLQLGTGEEGVFVDLGF